MKKTLLLLTILITLSFAKQNIVVSIVPEASIVKSIVADKANILTVVPIGTSPHTYAPTPSTMQKLQKSDLYFAIGVEFEKIWLDRFKTQNKNLKIVNIAKDIKLINNNPHIWLSIKNLKTMAKNIYQEISKTDPKNKEFYKNNLQNYLQKLQICENDIKNKLKTKKNKIFMTFHPAFTYFANEFSLTQIPIEINGKEPSLKELVKVIKKAKQNSIKTVITSPEFSDKSARVIAQELKANVVKISPLNPDICKTLNSIVDNLK